MPVETFKKAQDRILRELEALGWEVKRGLTYPWAKKRMSRDDVQLWFKTQSVYMGWAVMKDARSICSDYRGITGGYLEKSVEYYQKLGSGR
jgi:hypothetical protein